MILKGHYEVQGRSPNAIDLHGEVRYLDTKYGTLHYSDVPGSAVASSGWIKEPDPSCRWFRPSGFGKERMWVPDTPTPTWSLPTIPAASAQCPGVDVSNVGVAGGLKFDGGKPSWILLMKGCRRALAGVVAVLAFGAKKYAADSWKQVEKGEDRYRDALYRHLAAIEGGEVTDPESGLPHWHHVCTNALFLAELNHVDVPASTGVQGSK